MSGDLENLILSVVDRWWAGRYSERHGVVTSYDPNKYLAKVTFQPEGQESGWLPIETGHIGNGYGIAIGLQPGGGGASQGNGASPGGTGSPNQGDQVIVRYQEGDFESGKIVQRVHSDEDKPPTVQSGEVVVWTKFQNSGGGTPDSASGGQGGTGQQIYLKNDGTATVTDGNGATIVLDGNGNVVITCKKFTVNSQTDILLNVGDSNAVKINSGDKQVETITSVGSKNLLVLANGSPDPSG